MKSFFSQMKESYLGSIINLSISFCFIFYFYSTVLFSPNDYIFTTWGDGIKNYYTYAFYINNNVDTWNHEGFNYPYGENMFYTDCHPIVAFSIKKISHVFPEISNYSIGIINFSMIFSLIFTSFISYLILRRFKLPAWLSALAGFSIMVLSPQIGRITGHLALSYSFFIPLTLYLLILTEDSKKLVWKILQALNIFFWLNIHAYLGMIAASMLIAFYGIKYLIDFKKYKKDIKFYAYVFIQSILPIIIFRLIIYFTDSHTGRTDNPWGFFATRANFGSVFLPHDKPLNIIYSLIGHSPKTRWEGWAYIGLISGLVCISFLYSLLRNGIKTKKWKFTNSYFDNKRLQIILLSGILILLFSMAFPFKLGLHFLLDWLSVLKQFRATGRFAWVFFFIINYAAIIYLYSLYKRSKFKVIALIGILLFPIFNTIEGWNQHKYYAKKIVGQKNYFIKDQLPDYFKTALNAINTNKYQAIMSLPFYYIGGENYGYSASDNEYFTTELTSYHTKLPILGSHLTRNGIQEAKNTTQVISPKWYKKEIINDISSEKPFLLVLSKNTLTQYESGILEKAKMIYSCDELEYYEINYSDLLEQNSLMAIESFAMDSSNYYKRNEFWIKDSTFFLYENFDSIANTETFRGKGSLKYKRGGYKLIHSFKSDSAMIGKNYIASFWIFNCGKNFGQDILNISTFIESESETGDLSRVAYFRPSESTIIKDCWSLIEIPFLIEKSKITYKLISSSSKKPNQDIIIDELFIYEKHSPHYKIILKDSLGISNLFYNNHEIIRTPL